MKPHFIRRNNNVFHESFSIKFDVLPHFLRLWHYHNEVELVHIIKSTGTRFIGDSIQPIEQGELVLLGKNLPHKWQNDQKYFELGSTLTAESINVHFQPDFLGDSLGQVSELKPLEKLLKNARLGIQFTGESKLTVPPLLHQMHRIESGFERLMLLLRILKILSDEKDFTYITSLGYVNTLGNSDNSASPTSRRMAKVYDFVMNNFQNQISLEEVAQTASMNKSAFCRYFKSVSDKPFSRYLNEIRIGYACKLLLEQDRKSITEICFECGYNNLSNFHIQFRKLKHVSPSEFLKKTNDIENQVKIER